MKAKQLPNSKSLTPINITADLEWLVNVETASSSWIGLMWFGISWFDHRLTWDKNEFNISKITLRGDKIWIPDFRDVGMGDGELIQHISEEMFVVHHESWSMMEKSLVKSGIHTRDLKNLGPTLIRLEDSCD